MTTSEEVIAQVIMFTSELLTRLRRDTQNIEWSVDISLQKWDMLITINATYLQYKASISSASIELDKAVNSKDYIPSVFDKFEGYILRWIITQLVIKIFEAEGVHWMNLGFLPIEVNE